MSFASKYPLIANRQYNNPVFKYSSCMVIDEDFKIYTITDKKYLNAWNNLTYESDIITTAEYNQGYNELQNYAKELIEIIKLEEALKINGLPQVSKVEKVNVGSQKVSITS